MPTTVTTFLPLGGMVVNFNYSSVKCLNVVYLLVCLVGVICIVGVPLSLSYQLLSRPVNQYWFEHYVFPVFTVAPDAYSESNREVLVSE